MMFKYFDAHAFANRFQEACHHLVASKGQEGSCTQIAKVLDT